MATVFAAIAGTFALNPGLLDVPLDQPMPPPSLTEVLWGFLIMVPTIALTVKRFNDRNWPNWLGYAFGTLLIVFTVAPAFGYLVDPTLYGTAEWVFIGVLVPVALLTPYRQWLRRRHRRAEPLRSRSAGAVTKPAIAGHALAL